MSATLRVSDFSENASLFPEGAPIVINVQARQHPVTIHFDRNTEFVDYINVTMRKVLKIHRTLPSGGILVFMTGSEEIESLCSQLRSHCDPASIAKRKAKREAARERSLINRELPTDDTDIKHVEEGDNDDREVCEVNGVDDNKDVEVSMEDRSKDLLDVDYEEEEIRMEQELNRADTNSTEEENDGVIGDNESVDGEDDNDSTQPALVLPLYAMLSNKAQQRVFQAPPDGHRLIVVATNVAETSITIPNITYVVDTGREKSRVYDPASGVSKFEVKWISQASANQRSGRAGRTGPGHCYRLFSSSVFNTDFVKVCLHLLTNSVARC